MEREYTTGKTPNRLTEYLKAGGTVGTFRRRAVLVKGNTDWELICCIVEGFVPGEKTPEAVPTRRYGQALLHEDFLTAEECLGFAQELQDGHTSFGDIELERGTSVQWTTELVPVANDYMQRSGCVISLQFGQGSRASVRTLLAADQPYYPDSEEAARDWLPLRVYHGHSDGRNGQVLFLLPETRAYLYKAVFTNSGTLDITVSGSEIDTLPLLIKGAYWDGNELHHIEAPVEDRQARIVVPTDTDRLEYYLIDRNTTVYDFHREDKFSHATRNQRIPGSRKRELKEQVRNACQSGEGLQIEFKPFIDLNDRTTGRSRGETKLREVIKTVVAFSNTKGGHIYLGINDNCTISGINEELCAWAGEGIEESSIERYLGTLKSKIKDLVHGEVLLNLIYVEIDEMLVGIIEVSPAVHGPISIQQEFHLYIRSGASNRKAPPEQWKEILKAGKLHELY